MSPRYLLFDLDGTLIDTTSLILTCYRVGVHPLVSDPPSDAEILKGFGTPLAQQLRRLYPALAGRLDEAELRWRQTQEEQHDTLVRPFAGTADVLAELKRRGYPIGIVTSKERRMAQRGLALHGLGPFIDVLVAVDDTVNHKPHPDPVLKGLERLSAPAGETLYVGDSVHDMRAGRAAGAKVAAALWGPFDKDTLRSFGPDYLLDSIRDLLDLCPPLR